MNEDCLKFRAYDKATSDYVESPMAIFDDGSLWNYNGYEIDYKLSSDLYIIERCTGLKDRNGKLIYQGDVLEYTYNDGSKAQIFVVWKERFAGYRLVDVDGYKVVKDNRPDMSFEDIIEFNVSSLCEWDANHKMEVVGHIHEPKWGIESEVKE